MQGQARASENGLEKREALGDEEEGQSVNGGEWRADDAWFLVLQTQHPKLLNGTQLLSGVPKVWRDLFGEWVCEVEEAEAIGSIFSMAEFSHANALGKAKTGQTKVYTCNVSIHSAHSAEDAGESAL